MTSSPPEKIDRWAQAAEVRVLNAAVEQRIVKAGEFLEKTGGLTEEAACAILPGIDFERPVTIVRLPNSVFVRFLGDHNGIWHTDTGLAPQTMSQLRGPKTRPLFQPFGNVPALRSAAREIEDTWDARTLFRALAPQKVRELSNTQQGGGTQYIVLDSIKMREIR